MRSGGPDFGDHAGVDAAVVGAGAAGIGAARRLQGAGLNVIVLEAGERVGGRAHTLTPRRGIVLDLGCGWLHSADRNHLARLAPRLGFRVDASSASWTRPARGATFSPKEQAAYGKAFAAFERRLARASRDDVDRPASELLVEADAPWRPLFDLFSGAYNGAPLDEISVKDYAAYSPTPLNHRVVEGYGALVARLADGLDVRLRTQVTAVDAEGSLVRLHTGAGVVSARVAVLAVSSAVIASGRITFTPSLSDKADAARALPLGNVEKVFLRLGGPGDPDPDVRVQVRTDTSLTGGYTMRPRGMPVVEGFFGGALALALRDADARAMAAFAVDELVSALGTSVRRRLSPLAASGWARDPMIGGAYSHAEVGRSTARAVLASPRPPLFFAGEACSPKAFSTAHGAFETGEDAARLAVGFLTGRGGRRRRGAR